MINELGSENFPIHMTLNKMGLEGLLEAVVFIMRRTKEWSEHRSFRLVNVLCRLFGIFETNVSRMSGLFLGDVGQ